MVGERLNNDRWLELDEVVRRFAEAETLLNQTGQHLKSLLAAEKKSNARARSLSETARAVEDYSASAKLLLDEVEQNMRRASEILQAGAKLLDSPALAELNVAVKALDEQISSVHEAQSTTQAKTQRETKQEIARLSDLLRRTIQESHAKHTRRLLTATGVLLLGQVATLAVIVAVMSSP